MTCQCLMVMWGIGSDATNERRGLGGGADDIRGICEMLSRKIGATVTRRLPTICVFSHFKDSADKWRNLPHSHLITEHQRKPPDRKIFAFHLLVCSLRENLALHCLAMESGVFLQWIYDSSHFARCYPSECCSFACRNIHSSVHLIEEQVHTWVDLSTTGDDITML